jgi:hypothetical protein
MVVLLCLTHLLAMFELAFSAANKNQCMEQIIRSTYHRQPSPKLCVSMDFTNLGRLQQVWPLNTNSVVRT